LAGNDLSQGNTFVIPAKAGIQKILTEKQIPIKMEISENIFTGLFKRAFISLSIIIFFISFNFKDTPPPFGWYQQFLPSLNGSL